MLLLGVDGVDAKLIDVLHCIDHTYDTSVMKEMGLIKISVDSEGRSEALQIAEHFGCKTVGSTLQTSDAQITSTGHPQLAPNRPSVRTGGVEAN